MCVEHIKEPHHTQIFLSVWFCLLMTFLCSSCRQPPNREDTPTPQPSEKASSINQTPVEANEFPQLPEGLEKKPIVLKFSAVMDGITIGAALLPSLKAEYKMGRMKSHGMTGESERSFDADIHLLDYDWPVDSFISTYRTFCDGPSNTKHQSQTQKKELLLVFLFFFLLLCLGAQTSFTFELPNHKLCFQSKVSPVDMSTMPPSASLTLPPVTMSGEYIMEDHESHSDQGWAPDDFLAKPGNYLQGNYLRCVAEVRPARPRRNDWRTWPPLTCSLWCVDWFIWAQPDHRPAQPPGLPAEGLHEGGQWGHSEGLR